VCLSNAVEDPGAYPGSALNLSAPRAPSKKAAEQSVSDRPFHGDGLPGALPVQVLPYTILRDFPDCAFPDLLVS